jgi:4-amino-4-deoxy-L-arabinose transferase-like glycosyltransferase
MVNQEIQKTYWGRSKWILILAVSGLFLLGLGLRLYDLTDPPLDSAYRQLHAAIIARGMYFQMLPHADPVQRQAAMTLWHAEDVFEPPIFERIVALTYLLLGAEKIWVARVFASLFWLLGGVPLFILARKMTSVDGAIAALAFYLVLPFGVIISRRFQPDPFMVMWVLVAALALYQWEEKRDIKSAIWAGLACAIAIVVKVFAVFFIAGMAVALVLYSGKLRQSLRNIQVWLMAGIMILIPAITYLVLRPGSQGYLSFWSTSFISLLTQSSFYVRWLELLNTLFGGLILVIALAGVVIMQPKARSLMVGLWVGYLLFGLTEPWQIHTHDYYSLILVPIISLSLASVASAFFTRLTQQPKIWQYAFIAIGVFALAIPAWKVRLELADNDSHTNWVAWTRLGEALPRDGKMIALTDDYGTYVEYFGWRETALWPTSQDLQLVAARGGNLEPDFEKNFADQTRGMDYFLVTALYDLENQPELKTYLVEHYPYTEGDGYILFDLKTPLKSP